MTKNQQIIVTVLTVAIVAFVIQSFKPEDEVNDAWLACYVNTQATISHIDNPTEFEAAVRECDRLL